jgi:hypothetical protein
MSEHQVAIPAAPNRVIAEHTREALANFSPGRPQRGASPKPATARTVPSRSPRACLTPRASTSALATSLTKSD